MIVTTSHDNYRAYFKDDIHLAEFSVVRIASLTHAKQEQLIKKWLRIRNNNEAKEDNHAQIDSLERNINEIVLKGKILPRYPFFILSILQTHEIFMPSHMEMTAYGHCYYVLILAHLIKSGVDKSDESINPCLNFASPPCF